MVEILYRDSDIVVCVKPAGIVSQDAGEGSMPQLLREQLQCEYVAVVHRLDREVGGVMVYALSKRAAAALSTAVQNHAVEKRYRAVLCGTELPDSGVLEDLLFHDRQKNKTYLVQRQRKGVKDAKLSYRVLQRTGERTLVEVLLHTGRTHQIRVQFAGRKLPLAGDGKYGGKQTGKQLGLWSCGLRFAHPVTGEPMDFASMPPVAAPWDVFVVEGECECTASE